MMSFLPFTYRVSFPLLVPFFAFITWGFMKSHHLISYFVSVHQINWSSGRIWRYWRGAGVSLPSTRFVTWWCTSRSRPVSRPDLCARIARRRGRSYTGSCPWYPDTCSARNSWRMKVNRQTCQAQAATRDQNDPFFRIWHWLQYNCTFINPDLFFLISGLAHLIKIVRNVVQKPVAPRALQDALSLGDIKQIVYAVRKLMEAGSSVNGFVHPRNYHLEFFMPPGQLDHSVEREVTSSHKEFAPLVIHFGQIRVFHIFTSRSSNLLMTGFYLHYQKTRIGLSKGT